MNEIVSSAASDFSLGSSIVTIGAFDGFHLGHLRLLRAARDEAQQRSLPLVVTSFDRHPMQVLAPDRAPRLLMGPLVRQRLLASLGVDFLYLLHFDAKRAAQPPAEFVREVLGDVLGAVSVYVGANFTYGAKGAGSVADLVAEGEQRGFSVHAALLLTVGEVASEVALDPGTVVSATLIRTLIQEGQIEQANVLLGHAFGLEGVVVSGDHRGRTLGFPTANVAVAAQYVKPPDGVYAGFTYVENQRYPLAISLGTRPMYYPEGGRRLLEVFVIGLSDDLYGVELPVYFVRQLREQQVFDSEELFREQMAMDVRDAVAVVRAWTSAV